MTQNAILSLIAAVVIAIGFLIGWCASAVEPAPPAPEAALANSAGNHVAAPARQAAVEARAYSAGDAARAPAFQESFQRLPGFVRERTDRSRLAP